MGRPLFTLSVCVALAGPGALHAERAFDLIFRSGTLDGRQQLTEEVSRIYSRLAFHQALLL